MAVALLKWYVIFMDLCGYSKQHRDILMMVVVSQQQ